MKTKKSRLLLPPLRLSSRLLFSCYHYISFVFPCKFHVFFILLSRCLFLLSYLVLVHSPQQYRQLIYNSCYPASWRAVSRVQFLCNLCIIHALHKVHFIRLLLYLSVCCLSPAFYLFCRLINVCRHNQSFKTAASDTL